MNHAHPTLLAVLILFSACSSTTTRPAVPNYASEESAIRLVLISQEQAWNEGSIEQFMEGYWKSDSLQFVGTSITQGWQPTLDRYKSSYPDRATMGSLKFDFYRFSFVSHDACLVTGRYTLTRDKDQPTGLFTLLLRKISGSWVIVYDHTS
jgi:hypothetical protein